MKGKLQNDTLTNYLWYQKMSDGIYLVKYSYLRVKSISRRN